MTFFNICPRDEGFLTDNSNAIALRVLTSDGVDVSPDDTVTVTDLSKGYKNFFNNGSNGYSFTINVLIKKEDKFNGKSLTEVLNGYYRNSTPLMIHTDAIDIDSTGTYLITKNPTRKQTDKYTTHWELEFTVYNPAIVHRYKNDNAGVLKALKKAKKNNKKASTKNAKLRKCNYKTLVYSKKKKVVKCVKYMQEVLYKKKYLKKKQVDGWFGKETKEAVKKFQKAYNKKQKKTVKSAANKVAQAVAKTVSKETGTKTKAMNKLLPTDGKVDKATWKALCNA